MEPQDSYLYAATPTRLPDGSFILSYQVMDSDGTPLGIFANFKGATETECYQKAVVAHQLASRTIVRFRKKIAHLETIVRGQQSKFSGDAVSDSPRAQSLIQTLVQAK